MIPIGARARLNTEKWRPHGYTNLTPVNIKRAEGPTRNPGGHKRQKDQRVIDDLALHSDLVAQRMDSTSLLLHGPGVFISVEGNRKIDYGSCTFHIWAENMNRLDQARAKMLTIVGEQLVRHEMFTIDWQFSSRRGLSSASFDKMADPAPYDEAYPTLPEPVATFMARYLASRQTVLILQGPPGTGKTRLVRAILAVPSIDLELITH
jgi:hypothetical protein